MNQNDKTPVGLIVALTIALCVFVGLVIWWIKATT